MKLTKGKQKIEMKRVEGYKNRMITFSKRKVGIIKKMNEIAAQCDVEASLLLFSEAGKAHAFAHPTMEDAVDRVKISLGHEPFEKDDANNIGPLVEAYKKQKNEEIKKKMYDLAEELKMVEKNESKWWNIPDEGLSGEELKLKHQAFVELGDKVQQFGKYGDGSSSGLAERGHCDGGEAGAGEQT